MNESKESNHFTLDIGGVSRPLASSLDELCIFCIFWWWVDATERCEQSVFGDLTIGLRFLDRFLHHPQVLGVQVENIGGILDIVQHHATRPFHTGFVRVSERFYGLISTTEPFIELCEIVIAFQD